MVSIKTNVLITSRRIRKIIYGNDNLGGQLSQLKVMARRRHFNMNGCPDKDNLTKGSVRHFAKELQIQMDAKSPK